MVTQNTIISAIITLFLILITLVIKQNSKYNIWKKDETIKNLKSDFDVKDNTIRDLKGKVSELENKMNSLEEQLGECVEEKNKKMEEISRLHKEKEELTSEIKNLKTKMERVKEELQTCTSVKKSYEERVTPHIELKSFMTEERGKILGILKVDDIYNISFENKGYAPAFNIEGQVVYFPVSGENKSTSISIPKLLPNENFPIPLGGRKNLKDCSKITVDIRYKDIIGNIHPLTGEMSYL